MPTNWPKPAVSIMVFRGDHILLGKRAKPPLAGKWSLPGGRIEAGETVNTAALRELHEETGITAKVTGLADTRDIIRRDEAGTLTMHYVLTILTGVWTGGEPRAASDCLETAWVQVTDLAKFDMTEGTQTIIEKSWAKMHLPTDCT